MENNRPLCLGNKRTLVEVRETIKCANKIIFGNIDINYQLGMEIIENTAVIPYKTFLWFVVNYKTEIW